MKEYIKGLREKIGHDTIIQCAASIIVIDEKDRILRTYPSKPYRYRTDMLRLGNHKA